MILKLKPALKNYVWGGTKLKSEYNKTSDEPKLAESWELSLNGSGMCYIDGGEHNGKPLNEVLTATDLGENSRQFQFFPTLVKLIDAATPLSLQVHPSDDYALTHEHKFGKTEMWHILNASADAYIYLGFNQDVTKQQFIDALNGKTLLTLLNKINVKSGETYFVPSGTIHAIGAGVTLIEIQQNSDLTYRVYDYDRLGLDGKPRELHVDKALDVLNLNKYDVPTPTRYNLLGKCKYFAAYRYSGERTVLNRESFTSVTAIDGEIDVEDVRLYKGETAFISAGTTAQICGNGQYVIVTVEND